MNLPKFRMVISDKAGDNFVSFEAMEFGTMITLFAEMCKDESFARITCGILTEQDVYYTFADSMKLRVSPAIMPAGRPTLLRPQ